jgi:hypothetical protein
VSRNLWQRTSSQSGNTNQGAREEAERARVKLSSPETFWCGRKRRRRPIGAKIDEILPASGCREESCVVDLSIPPLDFLHSEIEGSEAVLAILSGERGAVDRSGTTAIWRWMRSVMEKKRQ